MLLTLCGFKRWLVRMSKKEKQATVCKQFVLFACRFITALFAGRWATALWWAARPSDRCEQTCRAPGEHRLNSAKLLIEACDCDVISNLKRLTIDCCFDCLVEYDHQLKTRCFMCFFGKKFLLFDYFFPPLHVQSRSAACWSGGRARRGCRKVKQQKRERKQNNNCNKCLFLQNEARLAVVFQMIKWKSVFCLVTKRVWKQFYKVNISFGFVFVAVWAHERFGALVLFLALVGPHSHNHILHNQ